MQETAAQTVRSSVPSPSLLSLRTPKPVRPLQLGVIVVDVNGAVAVAVAVAVVAAAVVVVVAAAAVAVAVAQHGVRMLHLCFMRVLGSLNMI